jgi:RNA polymerase sigma-70 factor (ECF subfamily)
VAPRAIGATTTTSQALTEPAAPTAMSAPQPSFGDVLDWHEAEIYRFALRLTGNRPDADDLFQETMLKAFRAFDRLQPNSNHRAWLYRIASNTFLSGRRKFDRIDSLDLLGEQMNFEVAIGEVDHAAGLDARALLQEIRVFVEHLPPKQRLALVLRKFHGLGYDDVAATLGCTEGAARTNVHQALRKLREAFEDRL